MHGWLRVNSDGCVSSNRSTCVVGNVVDCGSSTKATCVVGHVVDCVSSKTTCVVGHRVTCVVKPSHLCGGAILDWVLLDDDGVT